RIPLVDDELAILVTRKAVREINGSEVGAATPAAEAKSKLKSAEYHMVITDMKMETEHAGYEVVRAARKQSYNPATAILTAFPTLGSVWQRQCVQSLLDHLVGTEDVLHQFYVLLINHVDA